MLLSIFDFRAILLFLQLICHDILTSTNTSSSHFSIRPQDNEALVETAEEKRQNRLIARLPFYNMCIQSRRFIDDIRLRKLCVILEGQDLLGLAGWRALTAELGLTYISVMAIENVSRGVGKSEAGIVLDDFFEEMMLEQSQMPVDGQLSEAEMITHALNRLKCALHSIGNQQAENLIDEELIERESMMYPASPSDMSDAAEDHRPVKPARWKETSSKQEANGCIAETHDCGETGESCNQLRDDQLVNSQVSSKYTGESNSAKSGNGHVQKEPSQYLEQNTSAISETRKRNTLFRRISKLLSCCFKQSHYNLPDQQLLVEEYGSNRDKSDTDTGINLVAETMMHDKPFVHLGCEGMPNRYRDSGYRGSFSSRSSVKVSQEMDHCIETVREHPEEDLYT